MKVYFHGGPKDGKFEEIPDGRDRWDVYVPPVIEMTFKPKEALAQPIAPQIVTYVPSSDLATYIRLGLAHETIGEFGLSVTFSPVVVFVPRNTVDADGKPANHRWN